MGGYDCGVLVPLSSGFRRKIDDIGFLENIRGCTFDPVVSLVPFRRFLEFDWAWIEASQRWYPNRLLARHVYDVPEC